MRIPKLSSKLEVLLRQGVNMSGSYDPEEALPPIEEQLTQTEWIRAQQFLGWCHGTHTTFGWNLPEVWDKWRALQNKKG